jgi:hypothetical protein
LAFGKVHTHVYTVCSNTRPNASYTTCASVKPIGTGLSTYFTETELTVWQRRAAAQFTTNRWHRRARKNEPAGV